MENKIKLPNGTDTIPLEDLYDLKKIKDGKIEVDVITWISVLSDLAYLQGFTDAVLTLRKRPRNSGEEK